MDLCNFLFSINTHLYMCSYNVTEYLFKKETKAMFPLPIIGVALVGKIILSQKNREQKTIGQNLPTRPNIRVPVFMPFSVNPLERLFKGLNRQLSTILPRQPRDNFYEIAQRFVPEGSNILTPQYPSNSDSISYGDLDGDLHDELIVTFRHTDEIKTIILKKANDNWYKAAEIANLGYESVHYREVVDLVGEGKKQLIIALKAQGNTPVLRGYSFDKDNFNELFNIGYNRLEVLKVPGNSRNATKANLAIWNKEEDDAYNIQLLQWNGSKLESARDTSTYYSESVVPYYLKKVKRQPNSPQNWYNLANSLDRAGMNRDAVIASEVGIQYDLNGQFKDKFEALIKKI